MTVMKPLLSLKAYTKASKDGMATAVEKECSCQIHNCRRYRVGARIDHAAIQSLKRVEVASGNGGTRPKSSQSKDRSVEVNLRLLCQRCIWL